MVKQLKQAARKIASKGRYGDSMLLHVTKAEMAKLASTGKLTKNPKTGIYEAWGFGDIGDFIGNAANDVADTASNVGDSIGNAFSGAGDSIGNAAADVGNFAGDVIGGTASALQGPMDFVGGAASRALPSVVSAFLPSWVSGVMNMLNTDGNGRQRLRAGLRPTSSSFSYDANSTNDYPNSSNGSSEPVVTNSGQYEPDFPTDPNAGMSEPVGGSGGGPGGNSASPFPETGASIFGPSDTIFGPSVMGDSSIFTPSGPFGETMGGEVGMPGGMESSPGGGGFDWGNWLKYVKPAMNIGSGIYGLSRASKIPGQAQRAADQAVYDPFASQRAQYQQQLAQLTSDPNSVLPNLPGYKAGMDAIQRSMAANGYLGSGNMMASLQQYGGKFYQDALKNLMDMSGANLPPVNTNRGTVLMEGQKQQTDLQSRSLASIGNGLKDLF